MLCAPIHCIFLLSKHIALQGSASCSTFQHTLRSEKGVKVETYYFIDPAKFRFLIRVKISGVTKGPADPAVQWGATLGGGGGGGGATNRCLNVGQF